MKKKAPDWHLEKRNLSKLKDYPFNPRTLSDEEDRVDVNILWRKTYEDSRRDPPKEQV